MFDEVGNGAGKPVTAQDSTYQDAATKGYAAKQRPLYQGALQDIRNGFNSRGLFDSGLEAQNEMGLQNQFLNDVGGFRQAAAFKGADLGEENRQREQQRGWQVQDRDMQYKYLKDMADLQRQEADQQASGNLWNAGIGALGQVGGYGLGEGWLSKLL